MKLIKESSVVGAIDVGSNSIKLLVASGHHDLKSPLEILLSETIETRISQGISTDQLTFSAQIQEKAISSIQKLILMAKAINCEHHKRYTSAVRDAANRDEFAHAILKATGYALHILSGEQEASLIAKPYGLDPQLPKVSISRKWTSVVVV